MAAVALTACAERNSANGVGVGWGPVEEMNVPAGPGSTAPNLTTNPGGTVYLSWIEPTSDSTHSRSRPPGVNSPSTMRSSATRRWRSASATAGPSA